MNTAVLPSPLHIKTISAQTLSISQTHTVLTSFLTKDAPGVLSTRSSGEASTKASLERLLSGFAEEMERKNKIIQKTEEKIEKVDGKKRRKSEATVAGGKRRKVQS